MSPRYYNEAAPPPGEADMKWLKSKWKFVAFAVFLVAVLAAVIVGVTTHDEPGVRDDAPSWLDLTPDRFPLMVEAYEYNAEEPTRVRDDGVDEAMSRLNQRLGFRAFEWADDEEDGDVEMMLNAPLELSGVPEGAFGVADPGGSSEWRSGGLRIGTCAIVTSNIAGAGDLNVLVPYHELAHCLLFDHDCYETSIMCGGSCCTLKPTPVTMPPTMPARLSDFDVALARQLYAPR